MPRSGDAGSLALRQACDNSGVVGACAKVLSLKEPLASVLQSAGLFCAEQAIDLAPHSYCWDTQRLGRCLVARLWICSCLLGAVGPGSQSAPERFLDLGRDPA